jgi:nucleotidyltransferase/DNA polymerase involved in DNA repair
MFGYAYDFTPYVERTSIDEGYFDISARRMNIPGVSPIPRIGYSVRSV